MQLELRLVNTNLHILRGQELSCDCFDSVPIIPRLLGPGATTTGARITGGGLVTRGAAIVLVPLVTRGDLGILQILQHSVKNRHTTVKHTVLYLTIYPSINTASQPASHPSYHPSIHPATQPYKLDSKLCLI